MDSVTVLTNHGSVHTERFANEQDILEQIFAQWQKWPGKEAKFAVVPVMDRENGRYLLLTVGWDGYRRIHGLLAHIDIIDSKFWIQADNTEEGIATDLLNLGVPKDRIVLAFQHPERRRWGEFAAS